MNACMDFIRNAWKRLAGELVEPRTTTPSLALPFKLKNQLYGGAYDQWPPLRAWLVADPSRDVNGTVDDYERTLLLYAAIAGSTNRNYGVEASDFALARALLEYGADPNISDNYGMTPLHYAARGSRNWGGPQPNQSAAMVSLLIQHRPKCPRSDYGRMGRPKLVVGQVYHPSRRETCSHHSAIAGLRLFQPR